MAKFRVRFLLLILGTILFAIHAFLRHPRRLGHVTPQADVARAHPGFPELALGIRASTEDPITRISFQQMTFLQWAKQVAVVGAAPGSAGAFQIVPAENNGTHLPSLLHLARRFPEAPWYMLADDDTYVFLANVRHAVRQLDASKGSYLGYAMHFRGCAGIKDFGEGPLFAQSGSGLLISKEAVWMLRERGSGCAERYPDCEVGEVRLGLCLRDVGIKMEDKRAGFHLVGPSSPNFVWPPPCELPLAVPKASPAVMQLLYDAEREKREAIAARLALLKRAAGNHSAALLKLGIAPGETSIGAIAPIVRYADLYAKFSIPQHGGTHQRGADIPGGDFETLSGTGSWSECRTACETNRHSTPDRTCVAWSHDEVKAECRLKERIGAFRSAGSAGVVSGVVAANYVC